VTALFNDLSGRDRGNSEFVGSLTGTYTWAVGDRMEAFIRAETTNISSFGLTTSQDPRTFANQEGFTMVNGSFGLGSEDGSWGLQFWGRNLFEQDYTKGAFPSVGYLGTSVNAYPGDPRTYGVTLRIRG
jgi:iron complex outermembrane receptor protein